MDGTATAYASHQKIALVPDVGARLTREWEKTTRRDSRPGAGLRIFVSSDVPDYPYQDKKMRKYEARHHPYHGTIPTIPKTTRPQGIGNSVVFRTVRIATLELTRATPGSRVNDSLCTRSKSAMSETTTRNR